MACEGRKSATVEITFADGSRLNVVSQHPGVTATITPVVVSGSETLLVTGSAYAAGCVLLPNHTEVYGSVTAGTSVVLYETDNNSCPNGAYYGLIPGTAGNGTVWVKGSVSLLESGTNNGYRIDVVDATGNIFTKTVAGNAPTYEIACESDCPAGKCKCHSDSYPGYCCNDCGSTSAQINAITQLVKAKNHE
ncbi:MAG: hypothetical protein V7K67_16570 [Nostoc sp.]|uniref:hypothetical protein n=1 Tax=Nostoc sp. TaxID=1180 RepID=UPI002FFAF800